MRYTDLEKIFVVAVAALVVSAVFIFHPWTWRIAGSKASIYVSSDYKVRLEYPPDWQPVEGTEGHRFEGPDGFFEVGAADESVDISELSGGAPPEVELPYGSSPTVEDIEVDGERGGLVVPSGDQSSLMRKQSVLLVSYPEPIKRDGRTYYYFILWADKEHIRDMIDTLKFAK